MAFTKTTWVAASTPYITAAQLNRIEQGIFDAHAIPHFATANPVPVANGGTGSTTAANARTALGLGAAALLATPIPVASGGTGATDAATARTNLAAKAAAAEGAFLAYHSAAVAYNSTGEALYLNTEVIDTSGWFAAGSPGVYTPQKAGAYLFGGRATLQDPLNNYDGARLYVRKNGSTYHLLGKANQLPNATTNGAANLPFVTGTTIMYMNGTTDYVHLWLHHDHTTSARNVVPGEQNTAFYGVYLGVA